MTSVEKTLAYSRPVASAAGVGGEAADRHRFVEKRVLLTGEVPVLQSNNGAEIARDALLLLPRICSNITVVLPSACADLKSDLNAIADRIATANEVRFLDDVEDLKRYHAILVVGTTARPDLPWTVVNSNGWLARISSGARCIPGYCGKGNPIGAMAAAALGVADVFKRLICLDPSQGELLDGVSFSLWSYAVGSEDPGPDLPQNLAVDLMLVGCGAIGTGTAYLLSRIPVTGGATTVDKQDYGLENWGTCVFLGRDDIGQPKAKVVAELLAYRLAVAWRRKEIAEINFELGKSLSFPSIILNGLDDIDARHEVQRLWPDLVIDGAISSDFTCQVSCHPWRKDIACLICLFRQPIQSAESIASRATGLPEEVVANPNLMITNEHVSAAPEDKKAWLMKQVGKMVCSITPEAVAKFLSEKEQREGFAPSVPFVACLSASMIVCELVRYLCERRILPQPRYQLNLLWGPQRGTDLPESRSRNCVCYQRAANIESIRSTRLGTSSPQ